MVYDLKECDIKVKCAQEIDRVSYSRHSTNSYSNLHKLHNHNKESSSKMLKFLENKRSSSVDRSDLSSERKNSHLNYFIEIDHPYLQKCIIKSDNIFDALDFSKQLRLIIE